mmetsp:Transcript_13644/g.23582  ORF Transcript_13644/g.23582 Transcript_13644/m.23582 type:complete len:279 (+) Transcript_13644:1995-2831(+)
MHLLGELMMNKLMLVMSQINSICNCRQSMSLTTRHQPLPRLVSRCRRPLPPRRPYNRQCRHRLLAWTARPTHCLRLYLALTIARHQRLRRQCRPRQPTHHRRHPLRHSTHLHLQDSTIHLRLVNKRRHEQRQHVKHHQWHRVVTPLHHHRAAHRRQCHDDSFAPTVHRPTTHTALRSHVAPYQQPQPRRLPPPHRHRSTRLLHRHRHAFRRHPAVACRCHRPRNKRRQALPRHQSRLVCRCHRQGHSKTTSSTPTRHHRRPLHRIRIQTIRRRRRQCK